MNAPIPKMYSEFFVQAIRRGIFPEIQLAVVQFFIRIDPVIRRCLGSRGPGEVTGKF